MDQSAVQSIVAGVLQRHGFPEGETADRLNTLQLGLSEQEDTGMISYQKDGGGKRVRTRVGRFVRTFFGEGRSDVDIQEIGAEITAALWAGENSGANSRVKELSGEDIRRFYRSATSGIHSCMAYEDAQRYLDIYVDNPNVVKLATVRIGDQAGRALLWTFADGNRYMDRIYSSGSEACVHALRDYAERKGIAVREKLLNSGESVEMTIRHGTDSWWPYMDSMVYMNIVSTRRCTLSPADGDYQLTTTDGQLNIESEHCVVCGRMMSEDEIYNGNDGMYCESCYGERFTCCSYCQEDIRVEDATNVGDETVCDDCLERRFVKCEECEEYVTNDEAVTLTVGGDGGQETLVCEQCRSEKYFVCNDCHTYYHVDDQYEGANGRDVCVECAEAYETCTVCEELHDKNSLVDGLCCDCAMEKMQQTCVKVAEVVAEQTTAIVKVTEVIAIVKEEEVKV